MANKFITIVLGNLNKTEQDIQKEKVEIFVEDSIIECQQQIATLETSEIPHLKLKLQREEKNLEKAKKNYDNARFSIASNFDNYVINRNKAQIAIEEAESVLDAIKSNIHDREQELEGYKEILKDLTE